MIPTLGSGTLYQINKHRQRWLTELERKRAYRYAAAAVTLIAIVTVAYLLRP